ncbi:MAG: FAD-dependent oxidoreductase [Lactococcus chungangensis]|uniref:Dehydrogenase n=1 Tax=Pseudolactococcus chungangensis CAU 28 = DSM 22330 TaxID=1122154 RepID=A0A1K2HA86_9LACT|nr:FAD-dependent oxidoreductase [Lactococcus chungangensis]MDD3015882.1 FAD-dependent oxidoreductase [Lactococcus chungangensis]PCS04758.1 dehydrogenase [Lactococcus chungangensis CAU 28 = DSM 22330]SFZ73772.1 NADPH-dependent 2,4-dienoyl-CoA reductase, sulfur reductase [Lactococcus chungangensis CAU 28 = DSM 22330]
MKILIIGSVAAGTSVAAKARRNSEENEIVIYDKDTDISYAVCGIPYAIGGEIPDFEELTPRDAKWFKKRYNVDIFTSHEVIAINHEKKEISGKHLITGDLFTDNYDLLVFATGSTPKAPDAFEESNFSNVFQVKNINSGKKVKSFIENKKPTTAVVVGAGYIGLEVAEQLKERGIKVIILQRGKHPMSHLDWDMSIRIEDEMVKQGIDFRPEETIQSLVGDTQLDEVITNKGTKLSADMYILATGVRPNVALAQSIGVKLGKAGAIATDNTLQTNIPDVYAVGDVAESFHVITGKPIYRPLASTANKMGRIAGDAMTGGQLRFQGVLGTGILRFFDLTIAQTGLTEKEALAEGYEVAVLSNIKPDKPDYMHGKEMVIKAVADKLTHRILGVQIIGPQGVDKRIDVFASTITLGVTAEDLFHMDLAYAPPFSTTKDPVAYTGMALTNALTTAPLITPHDLMELQKNNENITIIDTRDPKSYEKNHVLNAINIPLAELREKASTLDKSKKTIVYCNKGVTGNASQNVLRSKGFKEVYNLSGGNKNYQEIFKHSK